jgi:protoporphyrin/coproporphyrin ferrochelatase
MRSPLDENRIGVLLMALGGPDSLDAVGPYLQELRGGRPTPVDLIDEIKERYRLTGGKSPVLGITNELAAKLERRLSADGLPTRVYVGFRHWHPFIGDVYRRMEAEGVRRVVGVCMAPQNSQLTVGAYIRKVEEARTQSATPGTLTYVRSWNTHPRLIDAIAANIETTRRRFSPDSNVALLFTAHSLPSRVVQEGDSYPREVQATVDAVVARVRPDVWRFAYQSQGRSEEPWLGPTVEAVLEELERAGHREVLVAPIGFVSDHVEILYDIDIEFQKLAMQKGMRLERIPMLNASPPLVDTLADVIRAHLQETSSLAPA